MTNLYLVSTSTFCTKKGDWGWCSGSHPCFKGFPIYIVGHLVFSPSTTTNIPNLNSTGQEEPLHGTSSSLLNSHNYLKIIFVNISINC